MAGSVCLIYRESFCYCITFDSSLGKYSEMIQTLQTLTQLGEELSIKVIFMKNRIQCFQEEENIFHIHRELILSFIMINATANFVYSTLSSSAALH